MYSGFSHGVFMHTALKQLGEIKLLNQYQVEEREKNNNTQVAEAVGSIKCI